MEDPHAKAFVPRPPKPGGVPLVKIEAPEVVGNGQYCDGFCDCLREHFGYYCTRDAGHDGPCVACTDGIVPGDHAVKAWE